MSKDNAVTVKNVFKNYEKHLKIFETYNEKISFKNDSKIFDETVKKYFHEIIKKLS